MGRVQTTAQLELREESFEAGGVPINYAEGPKNGQSLLLLHGLGRNWQDFLALIPELSRSWHIYAVDLRGHGKSGRRAHGYTSTGYAADIQLLIEEVIAGPVALFGHSLGGVVAMHVAAEQPERVRATILGDSPLSRGTLASSMFPALFKELHALLQAGGSVEEMSRGLAKIPISVPGFSEPIAIGDFPGYDRPYLLRWADCLGQVDPEVFRMTLDGSSLSDFDGQALLRQIRCPVLVLQASPELGGLMPDAEIERAVDVLANCRVIKLPLLGHALHLQQPQPVLQAVTDFLQGLSNF